MSEAAIKDAYDATKVFLVKPEERHAYINRQMAIMDYNTDVAYAREEGRVEEQERMLKLIAYLRNQNRNDDIDRMIADPVYLEKLYKEFGL